MPYSKGGTYKGYAVYRYLAYKPNGRRHIAIGMSKYRETLCGIKIHRNINEWKRWRFEILPVKGEWIKTRNAMLNGTYPFACNQCVKIMRAGRTDVIRPSSS